MNIYISLDTIIISTNLLIFIYLMIDNTIDSGLNHYKQLEELANLLLPNTSYNIVKLKQEMIRLKIAELAPQVRSKKSQLEQLTIDAKNKAGTNLEMVVNLLLTTQIEIGRASCRERV